MQIHDNRYSSISLQTSYLDNTTILLTTMNRCIEQTRRETFDRRTVWLAVFIQENRVSRSSEAPTRRRIGKSRPREKGRHSQKFHSHNEEWSERRCVYQLVTTECRKIKTIDETLSAIAYRVCPAKFPISAFMRGAAVQFSSRLYCKRFD